MQNKGLIKIFAILFALVCIYQLSFTFISTGVESDAEEFATQKINTNVEDYSAKRDLAEQRYLDSIGNENIFAGITYNSAKDKELNKGLDLKGGINVILQISVKDIIRGLANDSKDPVFNKAIAEADAAQKDSQESYIDLFFEKFNENAGAKLASPDIFANKTLSDQINYEMSNGEVEPIIREKVDQSILSAFEVLRKRIDKFGVTQPNIQRLGNSGRILVELPGAKDINRVKGLLQSTAQLEFWYVYKNTDFGNFLVNADRVLAESITKNETKTDTSKINPVRPVVMFASRIEESAFPKPSLIASACDFPFSNSSLILSNIRTFASTDIPMVNTIPAIPGKVRTAPNPANIPKMKRMFTANAISAYHPALP